MECVGKGGRELRYEFFLFVCVCVRPCVRACMCMFVQQGGGKVVRGGAERERERKREREREKERKRERESTDTAAEWARGRSSRSICMVLPHTALCVKEETTCKDKGSSTARSRGSNTPPRACRMSACRMSACRMSRTHFFGKRTHSTVREHIL